MKGSEVYASKSISDCCAQIRSAYPIVQKEFEGSNSGCFLRLDYTYRSPQAQLDLFKKGRIFKNNQWAVFDPKQVVTQEDGTKKLSHHNIYPSQAADVYIMEYGKMLWGQKEDEKLLYIQLGNLWTAQGLISGATWKYNWKDPDHVQLAYSII